MLKEVVASGRYVKVDSHYFKQRSSVKWDTTFLLPSLEYKLRQIAKDNLSGSGMIKDLKDRIKSLLTS